MCIPSNIVIPFQNWSTHYETDQPVLKSVMNFKSGYDIYMTTHSQFYSSNHVFKSLLTFL